MQHDSPFKILKDLYHFLKKTEHNCSNCVIDIDDCHNREWSALRKRIMNYMKLMPN